MTKAYLYQRTNGYWCCCCDLDADSRITVGREATNDVVVKDGQCSGWHFEISAADDAWVLRDLRSRNGTFVDRQRVDIEAPLKPDALIRVGQTEFLFANKPLDDVATADQQVDDVGEVEKGTMSLLLEDLKKNNDEIRDQAQYELVNACFDRLVEIARRRLGNHGDGAEDEEDAALSALKSLFQAVAEDKYDKLDNRDDLWRFLITITARKVVRQKERRMAQKRGAGKVISGAASTTEDSSGGNWGPEAIDEHDQELEVQLQDTWEHCLELLDDPILKEIAQLKLDGHLTRGIAKKIGVHERTVERKLAIIRTVWRKTWPIV